MPAPKMSPPSFYLPGKKGEPKPVPGAIAWYRCDDGAGQLLTDYSGNGNHGTLGSTSGVNTNDPAWNEKGLVFGGDDYVLLPDAILPQLSRMTVSLTVKGATEWANLLTVGNWGTVKLFLIGLGLNNNLFVVVNVSGGTVGDYVNYTPSASTPVNITVTYSSDSGLQTYINSVLYKTSPPKGDMVLTPTANVFRLGYFPGVGEIYACTILPFSIPQTQVSQQYAYDKAYLAPKGVFLP